MEMWGGKSLPDYVIENLHDMMTSGSAIWDELDVSEISPGPGAVTRSFTLADGVGDTGETVHVSVQWYIR